MRGDVSLPSFFENWLIRQEALLRQLESPIDGVERSHDYECSEIISQVISHYEEYYREKTRAVAEDVFLLMSPPWLSSFERSLLWISGFRPSILFRIVDSSVAEELTADQRQRIEAIKSETQRKEREVAQVMARVQETVAEQPLYGRIRTFRGPEESVEELKAAMVKVVGSADCLRGWTGRSVIEVLRPAQGVKMLAAAMQFQLLVRKWGLERDSKGE